MAVGSYPGNYLAEYLMSDGIVSTGCWSQEMANLLILIWTLFAKRTETRAGQCQTTNGGEWIQIDAWGCQLRFIRTRPLLRIFVFGHWLDQSPWFAIDREKKDVDLWHALRSFPPNLADRRRRRQTLAGGTGHLRQWISFMVRHSSLDPPNKTWSSMILRKYRGAVCSSCVCFSVSGFSEIRSGGRMNCWCAHSTRYRLGPITRHSEKMVSLLICGIDCSWQTVSIIHRLHVECFNLQIGIPLEAGNVALSKDLHGPLDPLQS